MTIRMSAGAVRTHLGPWCLRGYISTVPGAESAEASIIVAVKREMRGRAVSAATVVSHPSRAHPARLGNSRSEYPACSRRNQGTMLAARVWRQQKMRGSTL